MITVITRSRTPFIREDVPRGMDYVNEVGIYSAPEDTFSHFKNAILRVKTPYGIFVDDDDPIPTGIRPPVDAAILVGAELIDGVLWSKVKWPPQNFLTQVGIHKCVFSTKYAQLVLSLLPDGPWYPEWLIYSTLMLSGGMEYDNNFIYVWNKSNGNGHHREVSVLLEATRKFIDTYQAALVAKLGRIAIT